MIPRRKIYQPIVRGMPKKMLRVMTFYLLQDTRKLAHYFESSSQQDKFKTISQFCVSRI